jgi:agarase
MKMLFLTTILCCLVAHAPGGPAPEDSDWGQLEVPAPLSDGQAWVLDETLSDRFNDESTAKAFAEKWRLGKPDGWLGPGATHFSDDHVALDGGNLHVFASRVPEVKQGRPRQVKADFTTARTVYTGYVTSHHTLRPPAYTEARLKASATPLSSNFWLLSDDNTNEIDVVEVYGDTDWFRTHPSNNIHIFLRDDHGDIKQDLAKQGHHPLPEGVGADEDFHRYGVHWISDTQVDFYLDGEKVRTLHLPDEIEDPDGDYLHEPLRLIFDLEAHTWRKQEGIPTDEQLDDDRANRMVVDWVRTYRQAPADAAVSEPE